MSFWPFRRDRKPLPPPESYVLTGNEVCQALLAYVTHHRGSHLGGDPRVTTVLVGWRAVANGKDEARIEMTLSSCARVAPVLRLVPRDD